MDNLDHCSFCGEQPKTSFWVSQHSYECPCAIDTGRFTLSPPLMRLMVDIAIGRDTFLSAGRVFSRDEAMDVFWKAARDEIKEFCFKYGRLSREDTDPCESCRYYPPSSFGGKPCSYCDPYDTLSNCYDQKETKEESGWISVQDRLPNQSERVLIAHKQGVTIAWHNGGYWTKGAPTKHRAIKTVTHWMPLPQPPKEDDE